MTLNLDAVLQTLWSSDFYENFDFYVPDESHFKNRVAERLPDGWLIRRGTVWYQCNPENDSIPIQGWKIHVSAVLSSAEHVLERTVESCIEQRLAFKFALDRRILALMNSNRWPRGGSGKFITIYPKTLDSFKTLLETLYVRLKSLRGPYILSDRRYRDASCIYYRFGGMHARSVLSSDGRRIPVLVGPTGEEIPDERRPRYGPPSWVEDPFAWKSGLAGSVGEHPEKVLLRAGRYEVGRALAYTNCGGIYLAKEVVTGTEVVIKEARPNTGEDGSGEDAISRLLREHRILVRLSGTGVTPRPFDVFYDWEHLFLAQEYVRGQTLADFVAQDRNLILRVRWTHEDWNAYVEEMRALWISLLRGLAKLHEFGIVFGDLSPYNVIVEPTAGDVTFVDFGGAYQLDVDQPTAMFTPGFVPKNRVLLSGLARDYYAMGRLLMSSIWPMTLLSDLDSDAINRFLTSLTMDFGLPSQFESVIRCLLAEDGNNSKDLNQLAATLEDIKNLNQRSITHIRRKTGVGRAVMRTPSDDAALTVIDETLHRCIAYLESSITPERIDRIAPADLEIYRSNPLSVAYGASGILRTLSRLGLSSARPVADWISHRLSNPLDYPPGLYVGLTGIAWSLLEADYLEQATKVIDAALSHPLLMESVALSDGLSGVGLACLAFWKRLGDARFLMQAKSIADRILTKVAIDKTGYAWPNEKLWVRLGYGYGSSGIAHFLLSLYCATDDDHYFEAGFHALNFDLSRMESSLDGELTMPEFGRLFTHDKPDIPLSRGRRLPYLFQGSAGIGRVLLRYYSLRPQLKWFPQLQGIIRDCARKYTLYPNLFFGLAGLGDFLLDCLDYLDDGQYLSVALDVARGIRLFAMERPAGLAFPGIRLAKISCDFASGAAGVAMFLHRLRHRSGTCLMDLDELILPRSRLSPRSTHQFDIDAHADARASLPSEYGNGDSRTGDSRTSLRADGRLRRFPNSSPRNI